MLTPVEYATVGASILLAATRLLKSSKPMWGLLPAKVAWLAPFLPVAVVELPEIAMKLSGVKTGLDLVDTAIIGITLLLPGAKSGAHVELEEAHLELKGVHEDLRDQYADAKMALDALAVKETR